VIPRVLSYSALAIAALNSGVGILARRGGADAPPYDTWLEGAGGDNFEALTASFVLSATGKMQDQHSLAEEKKKGATKEAKRAAKEHAVCENCSISMNGLKIQECPNCKNGESLHGSSFFCSTACFRAHWKEHRQCHVRKPRKSGGETFHLMTDAEWDEFQRSGKLEKILAKRGEYLDARPTWMDSQAHGDDSHDFQRHLECLCSEEKAGGDVLMQAMMAVMSAGEGARNGNPGCPPGFYADVLESSGALFLHALCMNPQRRVVASAAMPDPAQGCSVVSQMPPIITMSLFQAALKQDISQICCFLPPLTAAARVVASLRRIERRTGAEAEAGAGVGAGQQKRTVVAKALEGCVKLRLPTLEDLNEQELGLRDHLIRTGGGAKFRLLVGGGVPLRPPQARKEGGSGAEISCCCSGSVTDSTPVRRKRPQPAAHRLCCAGRGGARGVGGRRDERGLHDFWCLHSNARDGHAGQSALASS